MLDPVGHSSEEVPGTALTEAVPVGKRDRLSPPAAAFPGAEAAFPSNDHREMSDVLSARVQKCFRKKLQAGGFVGFSRGPPLAAMCFWRMVGLEELVLGWQDTQCVQSLAENM